MVRPQAFNTGEGGQFSRVLPDYEVKIGTDGKGRFADNIVVGQLWPTAEQEEMYLRAYASASEAWRELAIYFRFNNHHGPPQTPGYWTPAGVFHGGTKPTEKQKREY